MMQRHKHISILLLLALLVTLLAVLPIVIRTEEVNDDDNDDIDDFDFGIDEEGDLKITSEFDESVKYEAEKPKRYFWYETFQGDVNPFHRGWMKSEAEEYSAQSVQWTVPSAHAPVVGIAGDKGLLLAKEAQKYAFGHALDISVKNKDLIVQFEVKFEKSLECGGAYIKLLRDSIDMKELKSDTPYLIMFGPDRCGPTDKVHFILQHRNPKSGEWEEKHMKNAPHIKNDQMSHVYTLVIRKDNSFEILIDQETARKGSLLEDFQPPINPSKEIDDPEDKKPEDWVDDEMILDPEAKKPEDWVDVKTIPDPEAMKPEDWDDEEDGEWTPPQVPNPEYVGEWRAPMIKNPAYKGVWEPRKIPNPNYFEDLHPHNLPTITGIAVEIWTMQKNIFFDNFLITDDLDTAKEFAEATWKVKYDQQKEQIPKPAEPTMTENMMELFEQIKIVVQEYPLVALGAAGSILLTIPLTIFCIRMITRSPDDADRKTDMDKDSDDEAEERRSEEEREEVEQEGKPRKRKKQRSNKE